MDRITGFFMPMIPPTITAQEHRIGVNKKGKPFTYKQPELVDARQKLEASLAKHVPDKKFQGAIALYTKWCFPIKGNHYNGEYKITKPDTDNTQKMLKDIMTDLGFWKDDAQVAHDEAEKFWADIPGIFVMISEISQSGRVKK